MKNIYSVFLFFICCVSFAQCPSGNVNLTSQADVNAFATTYPACTTINGSLLISGSGITDLSALSQITNITGSLTVYLCNTLQTLNGLNNIATIGGNCDLTANSVLLSVSGLENLTTIGGSFIINGAGLLATLNGLQSVTSVGNLLSIRGTGLTSLTGLDNLTSIGFFMEISNNPLLDSVTALSNLTSIGGYIDMQNNPALTTLSGLDNISPTSITSIQIRNSPNLSFCSVQSFCTFLTSIGGGTFTNNALGCNSQSEITSICSLGVTQIQMSEISIYPNPVQDVLRLNLANNSITSYVIYDMSGKIVLQHNEVKNAIDVSNLNSGMYILTIGTIETTLNMKFLKK